MTKILRGKFVHCVRPFNMLTAHKCSDTPLLGHLSNLGFCSLSFQKQITSEIHRFFQSIPNLMSILEMQKKNCESIFWF